MFSLPDLSILQQVIKLCKDSLPKCNQILWYWIFGHPILVPLDRVSQSMDGKILVKCDSQKPHYYKQKCTTTFDKIFSFHNMPKVISIQLEILIVGNTYHFTQVCRQLELLSLFCSPICVAGRPLTPNSWLSAACEIFIRAGEQS